MPQELRVVRCCTCEAFQVDIVKKIPKWVCKMCGEKQSLKKVYGTGTGKECRQFVQDLNEQRLTLQSRLVENSHTKTQTSIVTDESLDICKSKWSDYLPSQDKTYDDNIEKSSVKKFKSDDSNHGKISSKWETFLKSNMVLTDVKYENNHSSVSVINSDNTKCKVQSPNRVSLENIVSTAAYNNKFGDVSNLDLDLAF